MQPGRPRTCPIHPVDCPEKPHGDGRAPHSHRGSGRQSAHYSDGFVFLRPPSPVSSPPGEDNAANGFWQAEICPANPVARISKETADNPPSPPTIVGGEGRGEVARETIPD